MRTQSIGSSSYKAVDVQTAGALENAPSVSEELLNRWQAREQAQMEPVRASRFQMSGIHYGKASVLLAEADDDTQDDPPTFEIPDIGPNDLKGSEHYGEPAFRQGNSDDFLHPAEPPNDTPEEPDDPPREPYVPSDPVPPEIEYIPPAD